MSKRGRPPLPPERRCTVMVGIRLPRTVADGIFVFAGRNRTTLSEMTRRYYERLLARERELITEQVSRHA